MLIFCDIVFLANTSTSAEALLHCLEQGVGGISLHMNIDKTEYITALNSGSLKLVDKFTYIRSRVSSMENDVNARLAKAWTAIDKSLVVWKSDQSDKMKRNFFQAAVMSILLYGCTTWILTKHIEKKLDGNC